MDRTRLNYIIDLGLVVTIAIVFVTGMLKFHDFWRFFGISYAALAGSLPIYQMTVLHDWVGLAFGILALLHFVLHWKWIVAVTKNALGVKK